jgi:cytidylate kinase
MIIAIDGPAGSGKSTVAQRVAKRMGFHYLDTGAMYRAVAQRALALGLSPLDEGAVAAIALREEIAFAHDGDDPLPSRVFIAGEDVTEAIRTPAVDEAVSAVARQPSVRRAMVAQQRHIGTSEADIVVEGRDIGTVVFPEAEVKVYLTASTQERARRRAVQQEESGIEVDEMHVRRSIEKRDETDSSRSVSPLAPAEDAFILDTTGLSIDEVVEAIAERAESPEG